MINGIENGRKIMMGLRMISHIDTMGLIVVDFYWLLIMVNGDSFFLYQWWIILIVDSYGVSIVMGGAQYWLVHFWKNPNLEWMRTAVTPHFSDFLVPKWHQRVGTAKNIRFAWFNDDFWILWLKGSCCWIHWRPGDPERPSWWLGKKGVEIGGVSWRFARKINRVTSSKWVKYLWPET